MADKVRTFLKHFYNRPVENPVAILESKLGDLNKLNYDEKESLEQMQKQFDREPKSVEQLVDSIWLLREEAVNLLCMVENSHDQDLELKARVLAYTRILAVLTKEKQVFKEMVENIKKL